MQIQLKAKHYFLIVNQIRRYSLDQYLSLMLNLKSQLQDNADLEALITLSVTADNVIDIFSRLGSNSENLFSAINKEMRAQLEAQLPAGLSGVDAAEWQRLYDYIQTLDANNSIIIDNLIQDGKVFLQSA